MKLFTICVLKLTLVKFYLPCENRIIDVQKSEHQNNYIKHFDTNVLHFFPKRQYY